MSAATFSNKCIGKGAYGEVFEHDNKAIKVSRLFNADQGETLLLDNVLREATFYKYVEATRKHGEGSNVTEHVFTGAPAAIPSTTVFMQDNMMFIQMPLLGVPLHKTTTRSSKKTTVHIFVQVLDVLAWLHARHWSHGDLKPANILIRYDDNNELPNVSVIDYGSIMFTERYPLRSQRCTLYYVAPEELMQNQASTKSDIWSFGTILFEYLVGVPFVLALMTLLKTPPETIHAFKKNVNVGDKGDFNSATFLRNVYEDLAYGTILKLVCDMIKDRDLSSIVAHCLIIDVRTRASAATLFRTQSLLQPFTKEYKCPVDKTWFQHEDNLEPLSYRRMKHGGVDEDERRIIVQALVDQLRSFERENEDTVFYHALMLYDRFIFRGRSRDENAVRQALYLVLSVVLTQAVLQGGSWTLETIQKMIKLKTNLKYIHSTLMTFLEQIDLRLLNYSPDMIIELMGKMNDDDCIPRTLDMALYVPWIHGNICTVTSTIFPQVKLC